MHFSLAVAQAVQQFNRAAKLAFSISDRRYSDQLFPTQYRSESGHFDKIVCQRSKYQLQNLNLNFKTIHGPRILDCPQRKTDSKAA